MTGPAPPSTRSPVVIDTGLFHLTPAEHVRVMAATSSFRRVTLLIAAAATIGVITLVVLSDGGSILVLAPLAALLFPLAWLVPGATMFATRRWRLHADGTVLIESDTISFRSSLPTAVVEPVRRVGIVLVADEQRFVLPFRVFSRADRRSWDELMSRPAPVLPSTPYVAFTDDPERTLPYCTESALEWFPGLHRRRADQGVRSSSATLTETGIRMTERTGVREWRYDTVSRVRDRRSGVGFRAGGVHLFVPAHGFRDRAHQRDFAARLAAGTA